MKQTYYLKFKLGDKVYFKGADKVHELPYEVYGVSIYHTKDVLNISYTLCVPGYSHYYHFGTSSEYCFTTLEEAQAYIPEENIF